MLFWTSVSVIHAVHRPLTILVVIRHIFDLHGRLTPGALTMLKVMLDDTSGFLLLIDLVGRNGF